MKKAVLIGGALAIIFLMILFFGRPATKTSESRADATRSTKTVRPDEALPSARPARSSLEQPQPGAPGEVSEDRRAASAPFDFAATLATAKSASLREAAIIQLPWEQVGAQKELLLSLVHSPTEKYMVKIHALQKLVEGTRHTPFAEWTVKNLAAWLPIETHGGFRSEILSGLHGLAYSNRELQSFVLPILGRAAIEDPEENARYCAIGYLGTFAPEQALPFVLAAQTRERVPRNLEAIAITLKGLEKKAGKK